MVLTYRHQCRSQEVQRPLSAVAVEQISESGNGWQVCSNCGSRMNISSSGEVISTKPPGRDVVLTYFGPEVQEQPRSLWWGLSLNPIRSADETA